MNPTRASTGASHAVMPAPKSWKTLLNLVLLVEGPLDSTNERVSPFVSSTPRLLRLRPTERVHAGTDWPVLVPRPGFEPGSRGPKPPVLPLHHRGTGGSTTVVRAC